MSGPAACRPLIDPAPTSPLTHSPFFTIHHACSGVTTRLLFTDLCALKAFCQLMIFFIFNTRQTNFIDALPLADDIISYMRGCLSERY
jgi:hypothetical protein